MQSNVVVADVEQELADEPRLVGELAERDRRVDAHSHAACRRLPIAAAGRRKSPVCLLLQRGLFRVFQVGRSNTAHAEPGRGAVAAGQDQQPGGQGDSSGQESAAEQRFGAAPPPQPFATR